MRRLARENALCALLAGGASAAMAWLGLYGFAWNDYEDEARPAVAALVHGHLLDFLRLAPTYGGSLLERAPFALVPGLWGGGELAVYRLLALPCLLAAALLGTVLVAHARAHGGTVLARAIALGVCVANPITLNALEVGHPEELLGACLCVGAVLLAVRDRPLLAALLLGLAIANKEWAVLAVGPVLLACKPGRRLAAIAVAGAVAGCVLAPFLLASSTVLSSGVHTVSSQSAIFQPWQVWWFFGSHAGMVHGLFGAPKPGYRVGPGWAGTISHPAILLVGLFVTLAWWWPRRGGPSERASGSEAFAALALLLLLRCLLDTWDTGYYTLPFLLSLLAWELTRFPRRLPLLASACTVLAWVSFDWLPAHATPDVQAAFFLAWTLTLGAWLGRAALARPRAGTRERESLVDDRQLLGQVGEPLVPVLAHHG